MIRRPPRSTRVRSSAASDVYKRQLHEGRDAAALMAAGYVEKPGLLRSAFKHLFSARKSDWEKFDGIFDAFWLGKRVKSRSMTMGSAKPANSCLLYTSPSPRDRTR